MTAPTLSVAMPAYLEEENLRLLLPRLQKTLITLGETYEILVIDTATPLDKTQQVCIENGARYVPRRETNSFGDAVRTAIQEAQGEFILFMDSDGSHTPEFIPELYKQRFGNEIVIASRYVDGGITENSPHLILMSRVLNLTYSLILNLKVKDVSNSFKLYRASLLKSLSLRCHHFDIIEEILFKICRLSPRVRIQEVPFAFKKRMFGETKRNLFLFMLTYVITMIRLRLSI